MAQDEIMYNSIYFNRKTNTIHLWETINGKLVKSKYKDHPYTYYIRSQIKTDITDIYGNYMSKKVAYRRSDISNISSELLAEADLPEATKFLHDRYENVKLTPKYEYYNVLFYDIETEFDGSLKDEYGYAINSISAYCSKSKNIYVFGKFDISAPLDISNYNQDVEVNNIIYYYIPDEKSMLEKFIKIVKKENTQAITGWNTTKFDNKYIMKRSEKLGIDINFSPLNIVSNNKFGDYSFAMVADLDYLNLYQNVFMRHVNEDNYKLDYIANKVLGKGKVAYDGKLANLAKTDWDKFIHYNIIDTLRIVEMEQKLKFCDQVLQKLSDSITPYYTISSTLHDHVGMILNVLHKEHVVLNNMNKVDKDSVDEHGNPATFLPGAFTYADKGKHKYIQSFDFESLYPSLIRKYNIGPETLVKNPPMANFIRITLQNGKKVELQYGKYINIKRNDEYIEILVEDLKETDFIILD